MSELTFKSNKISGWRLFLLILYHPLETFEIIKMERNRKSLLFPALVILVIASLENYLSNFFVSFQFRTRELNAINVFVELGYVIVPLVVWVVADFCMTSILDGESKPKEIFMTACYCLAPYVVLTPVAVGLSHILGASESGFYYFIQGATLFWVIVLLFAALMRQNNYTLLKAIGTTLLCIGFMVILAAVFVFLLALSMQFISVIREVSQEFQLKMM